MSKQHSQKDEQDHFFWTFLFSLTLIVGSIGYLKSQSIFLYAWWKAIYLPQAEGVAWISKTWSGTIINSLLGATEQQAKNLAEMIASIPSSNLHWNFCWHASYFLGKYLLLIFLPVASLLTYRIYQITEGETKAYLRFKNADTFFKFAKKSSYLQAYLTDRSREDYFTGAHLLAKSPAQFAEENNILILDKSTNCPLSIDRAKAEKSFKLQLGKKFKNFPQLLNQSYGWAVSLILQFIPPIHREETIKFASYGHHYDFTVIVSLLNIARRFGVVPIAFFAKLKTEHRNLWYGLMNAGRKTAFVEGAAITARYNSEILHKLKNLKLSTTVSFENTLNGLTEAIFKEPFDVVWKNTNDIWTDYKPQH